MFGIHHIYSGHIKKIDLLTVFLLLSAVAWCQEKLGISNSNYSSTNSIFLNPSSSADSRTFVQVNLAGANAYGFTNLGYIPKFSLWNTIAEGGTQPMQVSNLKLKKFLYVAGSVEGPAVVVSNRDFGAGIFVRVRTVGEIKRVPFEITNFLLKPDTAKAFDFLKDVNLRNLRFSSMTWAEFGGNFAMMVKKEKLNLWTVGGSLRFITGINVVYGNLQRLDANIDSTRLEVDKLKGKLRFNTFGWGSGRGVGLDIGFTYKKMLEVIDRYYANSPASNCNYIDYKYKIGISLRDIGAIKFKKNTTTAEIDRSGFFTIDTLGNKINYRTDLESNFDTKMQHNPILSSLPTALSLQVDYNFGNHFYLNGTVVKNLVPNGVTGVQGANLVSICPRYEFRQFELAMPFTLQKFMYPQLGFAFRIRTFVLGFDNVFPLFVKKSTYGVNIYFNIGFSMFKNPACNKRVRRLDDCQPRRTFMTGVKHRKKPAKRREPPRQKKKIRRSGL